MLHLWLTELKNINNFSTNMLTSFHNTEFMQAHDVGDQTKPHGVINYPTKILFK